MSENPSVFTPPSAALEFADGLWRPRSIAPVSYPDEGNNACFQIEDNSYWFDHRNQCILELMRQHPPAGAVYDVGGGNGFVTMAMQNAGYESALVEPGSGARNSLKRGVKNAVWSTLEDCQFRQQSLPSAGAFDVVEHIEHDEAFLRQIRELLIPGGRFYATVPAFQTLWSDDDEYAGHFRRYTPETWSSVLEKAGFQVEYVTCLFAWLTAPVFVMRALPRLLRGSRSEKLGNLAAAQSDHRLPSVLSSVVKKLHRWELSCVQANKSIHFGSSLLSVARRA